MTQYNTLNIKLSNSQFNKLKSGIKNGTEVTLILSSNIADNSNDETNFLDKLLLTNTQISRLRKSFANKSSANWKLSKTQLYKIEKSGGFLGRFVGPLLKTGLPLLKNLLKPLTKSASMQLGLTAAAAAASDAAIQKKKKKIGSDMTTLMISNEEMNFLMRIIISLEKSGLLIKVVSETIENEAKEQKGGFLGMLLGTLGASLLENLLTGNGVKRSKKSGREVMRAGEENIRTGQDF